MGGEEVKSYLHAPELTDDVIEKAFEGTNFGRTDYREFLGYSVLKIACGWHCGHTITKIMIEMGLITPKNKTLTKLGRMFLSDCYDDPLRAATPPAASEPDGLVAAVNRLLDVDGSRGTFDAIIHRNALAEVERLLAAAPAPGGDGG